MAKWIKFIMPKDNSAGKQLILRNTLVNGQWFNWYPLQEHDYVGVFDKFLIRIKQDAENYDIHFKYQWKGKSSAKNTKKVQSLLNSYFQLNDTDLEELYKEWSKDAYFSTLGPYLPGVRILRQDPWECTISFLVSQNNNIKRITSCLLKLRSSYGEKIGTLSSLLSPGEHFPSFPVKEFFSFPTLKSLETATEEDFRNLGLGYRAKYIEASVGLVGEKGGEEWLRSMRVEQLGQKEWMGVREQLVGLKGVGKKVADCIALFSLDCHNSVPVDTHVHQIANRVYRKSSEKVSMTDKIYSEVVKTFANAFGPYCGWAHSVLFAAELPEYRKVIDKQKEKTKPKKRKIR
jgi:N-glycosylase/DNA lyase